MPRAASRSGLEFKIRAFRGSGVYDILVPLAEHRGLFSMQITECARASKQRISDRLGATILRSLPFPENAIEMHNGRIIT
jgi:hypothetical protein